jgi:hypothetical protein
MPMAWPREGRIVEHADRLRHFQFQDFDDEWLKARLAFGFIDPRDAALTVASAAGP